MSFDSLRSFTANAKLYFGYLHEKGSDSSQ
jgi:hypothetical protein